MEFNKKSIVEGFKTHPTDTGSAEVQIALLTGRINYLSDHFKKFHKDFGSRAGFLKLIGRRRRLLDYIKSLDTKKYKQIIEKLELRK
jgi:small subunit ribosomal protein S15